MMRTIQMAVCLATFSFMGFAQPAKAGVIVSLDTQGNSFTVGNTLGYDFTANQDMTVTGLGFLDWNQDGLLGTAVVGIWDGTTLLGSGTVASGTADPIIAGYRYTSVTPFNLYAGNTYAIGAAGRLDLVSRTDFGTVLTVDPAITINNARFSSNTDGLLNFMNQSPTGFAYTSPSFQFNAVTSTVPEPTSLAVFAIGACVAGLGTARRRRREKHQEATA